jgi:hypothetical protein
MSKEHTALPMQSLSVDEKHDPIAGHPSPTRIPGVIGNGASGGAHVLPGGNNKAGNEKKIHPAVIISIWIAMSSSVIGEWLRRRLWQSIQRFGLHLTRSSLPRRDCVSLQQGEDPLLALHSCGRQGTDVAHPPPLISPLYSTFSMTRPVSISDTQFSSLLSIWLSRLSELDSWQDIHTSWTAWPM